jgi:hypothetical protein
MESSPRAGSGPGEKLSEKQITILPDNRPARAYIDSAGQVRQLDLTETPYRLDDAFATDAEPDTPGALADSLLVQVAPSLSIPESWLLGLRVGVEAALGGDQLVRAGQKTLGNQSLVSYSQAHDEIPVWQAGVSVIVLGRPLRATSMTNQVLINLSANEPGDDALFTIEKASPEALARALGLAAPPAAPPEILRRRLYIFRYDPAQRTPPTPGEGDVPLRFPLPGVPESIRPGADRQVLEVIFSHESPVTGRLTWRALVDVQTGVVLYIRPGTAFCTSAAAAPTALIYTDDPVTSTGDLSRTPDTDKTILDGLRVKVTLPELDPASGTPPSQSLSGPFVRIEDVVPPSVTPPSLTPPGSFEDSVDSDTFAAANAYYHTDAAFRLVAEILEEEGVSLNELFDGTSFPVKVDHRWYLPIVGRVNAMAPSNNDFNGSDGFRFAWASRNTTNNIGISADRRIVLHEFGHALLWDAIHSANFGFAHSCGDCFASILSDPDSKLRNSVDRFKTFPWVGYDRRHDRAVGGGWGWYGPLDRNGYSSEQILSTTLFRFYRALGGDSPSLDERRLAARYAASLIVRGVGLLATEPVTKTDRVEVLEAALINADFGALMIGGNPGGAAHKMIRWSFEKQGLHRAAGAPDISEGVPPDVDVYIDDGRQGEYLPFQPHYWNTLDIWNRHSADGVLTHQEPVLGTENFVYVRVKNRGRQTANRVRVKTYQIRQGAAGITWPNDWIGTAAGVIPGPNDPPRSIESGASLMFGPIRWIPTAGPQGILASVSADGDLSNIDPGSSQACANTEIPNSRLVPFDNNLAQRNFMSTWGTGPGNLAGGDPNRFNLIAASPFDRSLNVNIESQLPEFLLRRGWKARVAPTSPVPFPLGPLATASIPIDLLPGEPVGGSELDQITEPLVLHLRVLAEDPPQPLGGATLALSRQSLQAGGSAFAAENGSVVFLVPQAETAGDTDDAPLSPDGAQRANRLARFLKGAKVTAVLASSARGAVETGRPTAVEQNIAPSRADLGNPAVLAQALMASSGGQRTLVVGPANRLLGLLQALGVSETVEIGPQDYDKIFVVFMGTADNQPIIELRY